MGADTFMLSGGVVYSCPSKLFRVGDFIVGGAGDWRVWELVSYAVQLAPPAPDADIRRYMATDFAKAVRGAVREYGCMQQDNGQDNVTSEILVGARGCLFKFDSLLSHVFIDEGFAAIGSGAHVAMGSLYESASRVLKPKERIERALKAAEALTDGVRSPFTFDCLVSDEASHGE
jgi:hypothetical protein